MTTGSTGLRIRPVTADLWPALVEFFGPSGAYSNCWCTWWRQSSAEYAEGCRDGGAGNRAALERLTSAGTVPGLLAFRDEAPVGWVAVAPRVDYPRIGRSRLLKPEPEAADDPGVWAVTCFWIPRANRRQGVAGALLEGAVAHAVEQGATAVEGYPVDTQGSKTAAASIFTGTRTMFERAGFREVRRRGEKRPVMRREG